MNLRRFIYNVLTQILSENQASGSATGKEQYSSLVDNLMETLENTYNVKLFIYYNVFAHTIILSQIIVPKPERNKGIGTKVMKILCEFADNHNLRIALSPASDFGGSKTKLKQFYKHFGFKSYRGYEFRENMVREPNN